MMIAELMYAPFHNGPGVEVLRDENKVPLVMVKMTSGRRVAVLCDSLSHRLGDLVRRDKHNGTHEICDALKRLGRLPPDCFSRIHDGTLSSDERLQVAICMKALQEHLAPILREIKPGGKVHTAEQQKKKILGLIKDALIELSRSIFKPKAPKADGFLCTLKWGLNDEEQSFPMAVGAIIQCRYFVEDHGRLPKKAELEDRLRDVYADDFTKWKRLNVKKEGARLDIWRDAGLSGLPQERMW